ncbi:MAG: hypothetical protein ACREOF_19600 [Gemmatimonadales bacterium]
MTTFSTRRRFRPVSGQRVQQHLDVPFVIEDRGRDPDPIAPERQRDIRLPQALTETPLRIARRECNQRG